MLRRLSHAACLSALLALGGCFRPTGPIVGDWRGYQPTIAFDLQRTVELILDGPPGARSGTYHLITTGSAPFVGQDLMDDHLRWTDHWERQTRVAASGQRYESVHLSNAPSVVGANFLWTNTGVLVPLNDPLHPDLSKQALRIALYPLPRDTYGYGRP